MKLTIEDFHGIDVTVKVTKFVEASGASTTARPGSAAWCEPPDDGELEYEVVSVDCSMMDADDHRTSGFIIDTYRGELDQLVCESIRDYNPDRT